MIFADLKKRFSKEKLSEGKYKISFTRRSSHISCISTNMRAIKLTDSDKNIRDKSNFYPSQRDALEALYMECKEVNSL